MNEHTGQKSMLYLGPDGNVRMKAGTLISLIVAAVLATGYVIKITYDISSGAADQSRLSNAFVEAKTEIDRRLERLERAAWQPR